MVQDGVHVSYCAHFSVVSFTIDAYPQAGARNRFEANMHKMFADRDKYHMKEHQDNSRHPQDPNTHLEYRMQPSGRRCFLPKALVHQVELWGQKRNARVSRCQAFINVACQT